MAPIKRKLPPPPFPFFFLGGGGGWGGVKSSLKVSDSEGLASNGNDAPRTKKSSNCYTRGLVEVLAYKSYYTFSLEIWPGRPIVTGDTIHSALQGKHHKSDYLVFVIMSRTNYKGVYSTYFFRSACFNGSARLNNLHRYI